MGKKINKIGLKRLDKEQETKLNAKVDYMDKWGYVYSLSNQNLVSIRKRDNLPSKFFKRNPYTKENILNYIKINNINIKLLTKEFINIKAITKLNWSCPIHGDFKKSWNEIKNGQYCPECGKLKATESRKHDYNVISDGFKEKGYILTSKKYINNQEPLEYICLKHKNKGIQKISWANLISGQRCLYCTKEDCKKRMSKTHEEFKQQINLMYKDKFIFIEKYENCKTKIKIYCKDCKSEFNGNPNHLLEGHLG